MSGFGVVIANGSEIEVHLWLSVLLLGKCQQVQSGSEYKILQTLDYCVRSRRTLSKSLSSLTSPLSLPAVIFPFLKTVSVSSFTKTGMEDGMVICTWDRQMSVSSRLA